MSINPTNPYGSFFSREKTSIPATAKWLLLATYITSLVTLILSIVYKWVPEIQIPLLVLNQIFMFSTLSKLDLSTKESICQ